MFRMNNIVALAALTGLVLVGCSSGSSSDSSQSMTDLFSYAVEKPSNFRVSLTDAPNKDFKSVFVNVGKIELWLEKNNKSVRLSIGQDTGLIDLLTLRDGKLLPIQDTTIPEGATLTQIRLILDSGNYAIKGDLSECQMQTPSGQQSGVKVKLSSPVTIESGKSYSLVVDFDALKSMVVKGNGDCLLKPVIKMASFRMKDINDGSDINSGSDITNGNSDSNDSDTDNDGDGYDDSDVSTLPVEIEDSDLIGSHLQ